MLLKEHGDHARFLPKKYLYRVAGERALYKEKTAGKYIREMLTDKSAVREARELVNSELIT